MNKSQWRKFYLELFKKNKANGSEKHEFDQIKKNLFLFFKNKKVENILIYRPLKSELPVKDLLKGLPFHFFYPEIKGEHLVVVSEDGFYTPLYKMDFIIVPGLFVNENGYRLGRGRGFYDRLLVKFPRYKTVFLGRSWQLQADFPVDTWDRKVGFIVTENRVSHCL